MGNAPNNEPAVFNPLQYSLVGRIDRPEQDNQCRLVRSNITGLQLEEYPLYFSDSKQYQQYLEISAWRRNRKHVAGAVYLLCSSQANFCGTMHSATLYMERYAKQLSSARTFTASEGLGLLAACLQGFDELYRKFGFFTIEDSMVWTDSQGEVWVWLNQDRSAIQSARAGVEQGDEQEMVWMIIDMVKGHQPPRGPVAEFKDHLQASTNKYTFQMTLQALQKYSKQTKQLNLKTITNLNESFSTLPIHYSSLEQPAQHTHKSWRTDCPPASPLSYNASFTLYRPETRVQQVVKPPAQQVQCSSLRSRLQLPIKGRTGLSKQRSPRVFQAFEQSQISTRRSPPLSNITFSYLNKAIPTAAAATTKLNVSPASTVQKLSVERSVVYLPPNYQVEEPASKLFSKQQYISTRSQELEHGDEFDTDKENEQIRRNKQEEALPDLCRLISDKISITYKLSQSPQSQHQEGSSASEVNRCISRLDLHLAEGRPSYQTESLETIHFDQAFPPFTQQANHPYIRLDPQPHEQTFEGLYYYNAHQAVQLDPEIAADLLLIGL